MGVNHRAQHLLCDRHRSTCLIVVKQFPLKGDGQVLPFAQSARIAVVNGVMADRDKTAYGEPSPLTN